MSRKPSLDELAQSETRRRLYGENGSPNMVSAFFFGLLKILGGLIVLALVAIAALLWLANFGSNKYVLECAGSITLTGSAPIRSTMFLDVSEYGRVISLWSDDMGNARAEIPQTEYLYFRLKEIGNLIALGSLDESVSGLYSPLSRAISINLSGGRTFDGTCSERVD